MRIHDSFRLLVLLTLLPLGLPLPAVADNLGCCVLRDGSCTTASARGCGALRGTIQ